jgi:hypothetical protein
LHRGGESLPTHNHFVLDRGGKVFSRSAPVIKLPSDTTKGDHFVLLGLLNSSVACFWMKQVFHNKGSSVDQRGARQRTVPFEDFWEHDGTKLSQFPLPENRPISPSKQIDALARQLTQTLPAAIAAKTPPTPNALTDAKEKANHLIAQMIALQEELDWQCYGLYNLLSSDEAAALCTDTPPPLQLGQRAFEILMARKMAAGDLETTWFQRHNSTPITEPPTDWPDDYKKLVEARIQTIQDNPRTIGLIEQPEYKRRWNLEPWDKQLEKALWNWLLDRLESYFDFDGRMNDEGAPTARLDIGLTTIARLSDIARSDDAFMEVAELYRQRPDFNVPALVADLVEAESVPLLPVLRYKPAGLDKRAAWERTWELQRLEDAQQPVGDIPVPPKYTTKDFQNMTYWRLRGKLDVPKERWISFPHCEGEDASLPIAWAGYDHLQQAQAIAAHYVDIQEKTGGSQDPRLPILLACLVELLPWLKQWHNDIDPEYNQRMGDYYADFVNEEARLMEMTLDDIKDWTPPRNTRKKRGKKKKDRSA